MDIVAEKEILIQWIKAIDNPEIISKIKDIKKEEDFDFEKEWKEGITIKEAREKTADFIDSLDWK